MKKISKITVRHILDDDDPQKVGTYSDTPERNAIDLGEQSGKFRYFNATCNDTPEDARLDYEQQLRYERGEFSYIGIRAEAEILTSQDGKSWKIDTIESGGRGASNPIPARIILPKLRARKSKT